MLIILYVSVCLLSYANGANDNFKGVATLYGSGNLSYRKALFWATLATIAGSIAALYLAQGLLLKFSGKGLDIEHLSSSVNFMTAVALGAGLTVLIATFIGFPISTTHALIGAMVGSGLTLTAGQFNLMPLVSSFMLPLLVSPLVSIVLAMTIFQLFNRVFSRMGLQEWICLCFEKKTDIQLEANQACLKSHQTGQLKIDQVSKCDQAQSQPLIHINLKRFLEKLHLLSAIAVCFARGLNDTPKIAALWILAPWPGLEWGIGLVAIIMALGGLLNSRRVAETMSHKITEMTFIQGMSANISTAFLVICASRLGLPVSTTHVSVGSLFGIGALNGLAHKSMVGQILLSWLITLPCAALIAALACMSFLSAS